MRQLLSVGGSECSIFVCKPASLAKAGHIVCTHHHVLLSCGALGWTSTKRPSHCSAFSCWARKQLDPVGEALQRRPVSLPALAIRTPLVLIAIHHLLQSSKAELVAGLHQLGALEWDRRWMLVDPECVSTLMELLQLTLTECGWHWSSAPQRDLEGKMQEAGYDPRCVLPAHVRKTSTRSGVNKPSQAGCLVRLGWQQSCGSCPAVPPARTAVSLRGAVLGSPHVDAQLAAKAWQPSPCGHTARCLDVARPTHQCPQSRPVLLRMPVLPGRVSRASGCMN